MHRCRAGEGGRPDNGGCAMRLLFIYGPVASGKLTIARLCTKLDRLCAVPQPPRRRRGGGGLPVRVGRVRAAARVVLARDDFGRRQRRAIARLHLRAGADRRRRLSERVSRAVAAHGRDMTFVALDVDPDEQERRLRDPGRAAFASFDPQSSCGSFAARWRPACGRCRTQPCGSIPARSPRGGCRGGARADHGSARRRTDVTPRRPVLRAVRS